MYCAKHVGPTSPEFTTATATLNNETVHPQRYPLPPPQQALSSLPGTTVSPGLQSTSDTDKVVVESPCHDEDHEFESFFNIETHYSPVHATKCSVAGESTQNDASTVMVAAAAVMVSLAAPTPTSYFRPPAAAPTNATAVFKAPTTTSSLGPPAAAPKDATAVLKAPTTTSSLKPPAAAPKNATAVLKAPTTTSSLEPPAAAPKNATAVLKAELQKRLAELKVALPQKKTPVPHYKAGEVMCFLLPKPDVLPAVLVNVYGILAHDVFAESNFGTCIMQDGQCETFAYTIMWAAVE